MIFSIGWGLLVAILMGSALNADVRPQDRTEYAIIVFVSLVFGGASGLMMFSALQMGVWR